MGCVPRAALSDSVGSHRLRAGLLLGPVLVLVSVSVFGPVLVDPISV
ncbi:hypothetical protein [Halarchaeum nitratireducens]|nr:MULTISPECIES: hypothetical protein [Halarchaeum]MBP2249918.1 hypothetical protein [Halarchaeum solikamskense]